jgi:hypothetical protein
MLWYELFISIDPFACFDHGKASFHLLVYKASFYLPSTFDSVCLNSLRFCS